MQIPPLSANISQAREKFPHILNFPEPKLGITFETLARILYHLCCLASKNSTVIKPHFLHSVLHEQFPITSLRSSLPCVQCGRLLFDLRKLSEGNLVSAIQYFQLSHMETNCCILRCSEVINDGCGQWQHLERLWSLNDAQQQQQAEHGYRQDGSML